MRRLLLLAALLLPFFAAPSAMAQSATAPPAQSQPQSPSPSQTPPQTASQSETPAQAGSGDNPQSLGDLARAANAQKDKPKAKHVFTDENLSSVRGTISVVGDGSSGGSTGGQNSSAGQGNASSASKDEAYWRGKAQAIKDQIADIDRQIDAKKAEIAKAGPASFDPSAGLSQGVIIVHDRNAELKDLEDRKQRLQAQLDSLADEGRKDGADSGWFR
ncbi:MAG: hypothetical protein ABR973_12945 [Candidatus Acidiferrales bacterium]|jgi:hypothetical protein